MKKYKFKLKVKMIPNILWLVWFSILKMKNHNLNKIETKINRERLKNQNKPLTWNKVNIHLKMKKNRYQKMS